MIKRWKRESRQVIIVYKQNSWNLLSNGQYVPLVSITKFVLIVYFYLHYDYYRGQWLLYKHRRESLNDKIIIFGECFNAQILITLNNCSCKSESSYNFTEDIEE